MKTTQSHFGDTHVTGRVNRTCPTEHQELSAFSDMSLRAMVEGLIRRDASEDLQGTLSTSESDALSADEDPSQNEIDQAISAMLRTEPLAPQDYLAIGDHVAYGERENAYLALRLGIAHALVMPTPGNLHGLADAVLRCARLTLREDALGVIREAV